MLYPKNNSHTLEHDLFKNPTNEYRGTPFWSWNCKLNKELLIRQIECFKKMGLGGFHMHSRTGMATKYLSEEFMELVKACVKKAEDENMLAWLYDEDRWPSGSAGGLVTKEHKYRTRMLVFSPQERMDCVSKEDGIQFGKTYFLACYDILLNEKGELASYQRINKQDQAKGAKWYAYVVTSGESPWYNNQTYVDTLSKEAIDQFIELTYQGYKKAVGEKFGNTIPAIFTDEPQFARKQTLHFAREQKEVLLPWTGDIPETYQKVYQSDLLDNLPELFWELPDQRVSKTRYHYHDHIAERFAQAFADNCGQWCEKNNLMLTGHMMGEPTLESQTAELGEAMRSYRSFQLPGIDMLCNHVELTTAKQAQSACHQYGREGVLSELYGVTNWDFDFRGHKFQGDWQAALGVTVRVHHLSWVSMAGEAKRDYPASISYQSPWYQEYGYIEDHFARVNTALTRGKPVVKVAVIHPVESYWLHWGPRESTNTIREQLDHSFEAITNWLLTGQIDFDFICESLLPDLCPIASNPIKVGQMQYSTILVPACETLRQSTIDRLVQFKKDGGRLIFVGECPKYVDAQESEQVKSLYFSSERVPFAHASLLSALDCERELKIHNADGTLANHLIYQMRQDQDCKWLFLAQVKYTVHKDAVKEQRIVLTIKGEYTPILFDTISGEITAIDFHIADGNTIIECTMNCHDSLLIKLDKKTEDFNIISKKIHNKVSETDFKQKVSYIREEPNVLLLDRAQYALDDETFHQEEEILRIDNLLRDQFGWPSRQDKVAQPWTMEPEEIKHFVTLKFVIQSDLCIHSASLALEDAEHIKIIMNNKPVDNKTTGYYVDESIKTVALPSIKQGENILELTAPFGKTTNLEYCYLLGDFDVKVEGCTALITAKSDTIGFSSITHQGMPFYGGNITYQVEVETSDCSLGIKANHYRGALIGVKVDGKRVGVIAFAPYRLMVEKISAGKHIIEFTLFGNRFNTFAALHNTETQNTWYGPDYWRSKDDSWCYEYMLKDTGILSSPVIEIYE